MRRMILIGRSGDIFNVWVGLEPVRGMRSQDRDLPMLRVEAEEFAAMIQKGLSEFVGQHSILRIDEPTAEEFNIAVMMMDGTTTLAEAKRKVGPMMQWPIAGID